MSCPLRTAPAGVSLRDAGTIRKQQLACSVVAMQDSLCLWCPMARYRHSAHAGTLTSALNPNPNPHQALGGVRVVVGQRVRKLPLLFADQLLLALQLLQLLLVLLRDVPAATGTRTKDLEVANLGAPQLLMPAARDHKWANDAA